MTSINKIFPEHLLWSGILEPLPADSPQLRAVCTQWRRIVDGEYQKKLERVNSYVPLNQAVKTYLQLTRFVPQFFNKVFDAPPLERILNPQMIVLAVLKKCLAGKSVNLSDLMKLGEYAKKGERALEINATTMPEKKRTLGIASAIINFARKHFKEEDPCAVNAMSTLLMNTYGNLIHAEVAELKGSVEYFLDQGPEEHIIQAAITGSLQLNHSDSRRLLQYFQNHFELPTFDIGFNRDLAKCSVNKPWLQKFLFKLENKLLQTRPFDFTTTLIGPLGTIHGSWGCPHNSSTNLHEAIEDQNYFRVLELVKRGYDVNRPDSALRTPLILAARGNDPFIIIELLKAGADPNVSDFWDFTAMDWLVASKKEGLLQICKHFGANEERIERAKGLTKSEKEEAPNILEAPLQRLQNVLEHGARLMAIARVLEQHIAQ